MYGGKKIGAAIQNFLLRITDLGLGSCWISAFLDNEIKNALNIPEKIKIEALLPVGYPDEKPRAPKKAALQDVIYWDKWNVKKKPHFLKDPATW